MRTIIFDWKWTLYDPENRTLVPGALDLLTFLRKKHRKLVLIGKGGKDMHDEVMRLNVNKYFTKVLFQEGGKGLSLFARSMDEL